MRKLSWQSIKTSFHFRKVSQTGKKFYSPFFLFFTLPSDNLELGVIASRKVGNAVKRNKAKRLLKAAFSEVFQSHKNESVVIIARQQILNAEYSKIIHWMKKASCEREM